MPSFQIPDGPVTIEASRSSDATAVYTVKNVSGGSRDARLSVVVSGQSKTEWFSIDGNLERAIPAGQEQTVVIRVKMPREAPEGDYHFRLRAVEVNDTDNDFVEGPVTVAKLGPPPPPTRDWTWLWILLGLLALLAIGGGLYYALRPGPSEQTKTCSDKSVIPANSTCTETPPKCPDGSVKPTNGTCPTPAKCPDGSVVSANGTCPTPAKCPDGSEMPANGTCPVHAKRLCLHADVPWLDTGVTVRKGDRLQIIASGKWSNIGPPEKGPEGFAGYRLPEHSIVSGADFASLVARVGSEAKDPSDARLIPVGAKVDLGSPADGELYLSMNDDYFPDNKGSLDVSIAVGSETLLPVGDECRLGQ
jgi:hypothetical protein